MWENDQLTDQKLDFGVVELEELAAPYRSEPDIEL